MKQFQIQINNAICILSNVIVKGVLSVPFSNVFNIYVQEKLFQDINNSYLIKSNIHMK